MSRVTAILIKPHWLMGIEPSATTVTSNRIAVIKAIRDMTGMSLQDSKETVDAALGDSSRHIDIRLIHIDTSDKPLDPKTSHHVTFKAVDGTTFNVTVYGDILHPYTHKE